MYTYNNMSTVARNLVHSAQPWELFTVTWVIQELEWKTHDQKGTQQLDKDKDISILNSIKQVY